MFRRTNFGKRPSGDEDYGGPLEERRQVYRSRGPGKTGRVTEGSTGGLGSGRVRRTRRDGVTKTYEEEWKRTGRGPVDVKSMCHGEISRREEGSEDFRTGE